MLLILNILQYSHKIQSILSNKNSIRNQIQLDAVQSNIDAGGFSTLALCTGAGKSRCAVLRAKQIVEKNPDALIFLSVPTTKLRDANWKDEFDKWDASDIYQNNLIRSCYVSMQKHKGLTLDFVILDEAHRLTEDNLEFFENNTVNSIMGLTATYPKKGLKKDILDAIAPVSYIYTLEQGVKDGFVTPFQIHVLMMDLDKYTKYVKAGNVKKRWFQTEVQKYDNLQTRFEAAKEDVDVAQSKFNQWLYGNNLQKNSIVPDNFKDSEFYKLEKELTSFKKKFESIIFERRLFIRGLRSKTNVGRRLLDKNFNPEVRRIVFCGSIEQADTLCGENVFHSKVKDIAYNRFKNLEIDELGVVDALNEGHNLPNVTEAYAVQLNSQELHTIQRIGRIIRYIEGHIAQFFVICVRNTVDEQWVKKALQSFADDLITWHDAEEYLNS